MVHKKYTYRDGKRFGPYYYETKRNGDKIITTYLGNKNPKINNSPTRFFLKNIAPFLAIFLFLALLFLPVYFTGNLALDIKTNYKEGEFIDGTLTFIFKEGELIPIDSKVLFTYGDLSKEILLSSLVSESSVSGDFYAEGVSFSGSGEGYGLIGSKKTYPEISFSLKIIDGSESEKNSESNEITETPETPEEINSENSQDENSQNEVENSQSNGGESIEEVSESNEEEEINSENSQDEIESAITGNVISSNVINGVVSKDKDFIYSLSEDDAVELVSGSIDYKGNKLDDNVVQVKTKKGEVIVTTDYVIEMGGFGEEYLGNEKKKIQIDLSEFGFIADSSREISVSLVYQDNEIVSASEDISVEKNENLIGDENNETEINASIINETIIEVTNETIIISNITNITNGTTVQILNDSAFNVNVTQFNAVLGQPVRWEKKIVFDTNSSVELHVEIPESAENITLSPINLTEYLEIEGLTEAEYIARSGNSVPQISESVSNVSSEITNASSVQQTSLANDSSMGEEITISITGQIISGRVSANIDLSGETWFKRFFGRIFGITGRVISDPLNVSMPVQAVNVSLSDKDFGVAVEYYTSAPVAEEFSEGSRKTIAVSSPSDVHYENVLIYTNLSDDFKINDLTSVKIEWLENASQKLEIYSANDTNGNGYYDYIEWIAPKLSNQTFNIIVIINAQHLNSTRGFISNIYNETRELDGIWSEPIYAGDFVRVTFERNLTNVNDITIYPRAVNGTNISEIAVEVYEINKNETIARFTNIVENNYNKVFLTGLAENYSQDVFDLLILNGSLEFDHIIDPIITYNNYSTDISLAPLDNQTFVIAYVNASSNNILFSIFDTNGSTVLAPIRIDGGANISYNYSRVSVASFNSTTFMVGWTNRSGDRRAIYTRTGTLKAGPSFGDGSLGISAHDIKLSYMEGKVFYCYTDFTEGDSDLRIYNATTNAAYGIAETDVNAAVIPEKNITNIIDCVTINSSRVGYFEFDDAADNDATYHFLNSTGSEIVTDTDIDTAASDFGRVAVASLDKNKFVLVWHNSSSVRFAIKSANNSDILVATSVSITGSNTRSQLATATVKNQSSNLDNVVIIWHNQTNTRLLGKVYNGSGTIVTNEFIIDEDPISDGLLYALGEDDANELSLCPNKWIVAYTNITNVSVVKSYNLNGSIWDGICSTSVQDTTYPLFFLYNETPTNGSLFNASIISSFNVTINNTNGTVWFQINNLNYTATNLSNNIYNVSINLGVGNYYYNWSSYGNGSTKLFNISSQIYYSINKASSIVNLTLNFTQGNITIAPDTSIMFNVTKILGDANYTLRLYSNNTLINEGNASLSNLTNFATIGLYNITAVYLNTQNYTQSSETLYVNVSEISYFNLNATVPSSNGAIFNVTFLMYPANSNGFNNIFYQGTNQTLQFLPQAGYWNMEFAFENKKINKISFGNYSLVGNVNNVFQYEDDINSTSFDSTFAVDVASSNYTNATLYFNATAESMYKCANWNFTAEQCIGGWRLLLNNLVIGEQYNITLTPGDPGYGQINITDAIHLDENYSFLNNQYAEVVNLDGLWSEHISHREYVRITFVQNLTSVNDITLYSRNVQNRSTIVEVYLPNTTTKLTQFPVINTTQYYKVYLTNLSAANETDTFDLRVLSLDSLADSYLEFDHIIDPNVPPNFSLRAPTNASSQTTRSVNISMLVDDQDNNGTGGIAHVYVDTKTPIITNEHIVYVLNATTDPQIVEFNYSIPPLKYVDYPSMFLLYHFDNNTLFGENKTYVNDFATGSLDGNISLSPFPAVRSIIGGGFDNRGARIALGDSALLNSPSVTGELTIMFWVNMTRTDFAVSFPPVVTKQVDTNNRDYLIHFTNASKTWTLSLGNGSLQRGIVTAVGSFNNSNNTWYHLAFTFNKTTQNATIYVNGRANVTQILDLGNTSLVDTAATLSIMGAGGLNTLNNSIIDDFALFNKTLNATEILDIYRLRDGAYYWRVNATDAVGGWNNSDTYLFYVDNVVPNVTLNWPSNTTSFLDNVPSISLNWTSLDFVDISLLCNVTIGTSINKSNVVSTNGTMINVSVTGFTAGTYHWNTSCLDDAGNINTSATYTFTVTSSNSAPYNTSAIIINSTTGLNRTIDSINVKADIVDNEANLVNVTVKWYNNSVLHAVDMYNNSYTGDGFVFIATLPFGNLTRGHNWTAGLILSDGTTQSAQINATINVTVLNSIPYNLSALILNGTTVNNRSNETIFVRTTLFDLDSNDGMNVTVTWFNSSLPAFTIMYNNSYSNGTVFIANLTAGNTTRGHNWSVQFQINDGVSNFVVNSSNITIRNTPPNITLLTPANGNVTTLRKPTFTWAVSDEDTTNNKELISQLNLSYKAQSNCVDSKYNGDTANIIEIGGNETWTLVNDLACFIDKGDYYNWSMRVYDDFNEFSDWTSGRNLSLQALIAISLNISSVDFGNIREGQFNDTSDNSPKPLIIVNDGNALSNITLSINRGIWNLYEQSSTPYYQFKVDNVSTNGISENGSFKASQTPLTYANFRPEFESICVAYLNHTDVTDSVEVDINVTVPTNEPPGARNSLITFTASFTE